MTTGLSDFRKSTLNNSYEQSSMYSFLNPTTIYRALTRCTLSTTSGFLPELLMTKATPEKMVLELMATENRSYYEEDVPSSSPASIFSTSWLIGVVTSSSNLLVCCTCQSGAECSHVKSEVSLSQSFSTTTMLLIKS